MKRGGTAIALALAACAAAADTDANRRAGDLVSLALPLGTLAVEAWRGDGEAVRQYAAAFAAGLGAVEVLKNTTGVERPDGSNDRSFPSGHAARAFAAATAVHRRHGLDAAWPLYAAATWVGWTRVQADRHRWADVAGAAAVTALASGWLVEAAPGVQVTWQPGGVQVQWRMALP